MNQVLIIGRLAREPELKYLPSGMGVTKMTVAVDRELSGEKKQEAINKGEPTADFLSVVVFGKQAETAASYLQKGSKCAVSGRIQTGSYNKQDGTKVYTTDIIASRLEFLDSKPTQQAQSKQQDEDIFQPVGDDDDIPF